MREVVCLWIPRTENREQVNGSQDKEMENETKIREAGAGGVPNGRLGVVALGEPCCPTLTMSPTHSLTQSENIQRPKFLSGNGSKIERKMEAFC